MRTDRTADTQLSDVKDTASERAGFAFIWVPLCTTLRTFGRWFGFFTFGYLGIHAFDTVTRTWELFNHPSWVLKALDKLDFFRSLTMTGAHAELQSKYCSYLGTGGRISTHDLDYGAHYQALLYYLPSYPTIQFFFIRCRTKLVLEHANCKDAVFTRFEDANIGPNSQRPCFTRAMVSMENKSCHNTEIRKQPTRTHRNLICSLEVTVWKRSIVYLCLACLADKNL